MPRLVSFFALLAIVVLVSVLFFQVIATFVLPLFLALILVVIFRPMYRWIVVKCKGRDRIGAAVTTLAVALIVLVPTLGFLTFAGIEAASVVTGMGDDDLSKVLDKIRAYWGLEMPASLTEVEQYADALDVPLPLTNTQFVQVQNAAAELSKSVEHLRLVELNLPDPPAEPKDADEELSAAIADFVRELNELQQWKDHDYNEAAGELLQSLRDTYFIRLRPQLVDRALPQTHSRLKVWLVVQSHPNRTQLRAIRRQAVDWLSSDALGPLALSTGRRVVSFLIGLVIMLVALYFFLADGPAMAQAAIRLAPLDKNYVEQLLTEFDKVSRAVVVATLLAALAQGLLAGIGYWFAGLESVFLLTMLTGVLAMIPFVGATSVWLPCCLWVLIIDGNPLAAGLLALYCVSIVSTVDNIIKPLVLHGQSNIHPLLALLSVLGGVKALGPIGVFVGPMAVAFLQALLNMFRTELAALGGQGKEAKAAAPD